MSAPRVGVFDSGVGGLSVWRALQQALPGAQLHYLADNAWAPYGERPAEALRERTLALVRAWREHEALDMLVLACNTATAVAVDALRAEHPDLPIVGMEPALRPGLAATLSGHVGVVATSATLQSPRYLALRNTCLGSAREGLQLHERACTGLADAIERGDSPRVWALCRTHLQALLAEAPGIDTLVLGCTHYPLVNEAWRAASDRPLTLIDPAEAVARRALSLLGPVDSKPVVPIWRCTGGGLAISRAAAEWLGMEALARTVVWCPIRPAM